MTSSLVIWLVAAPALAAVVIPLIGSFVPGWRSPLDLLAHLGVLVLALFAFVDGTSRVLVEVQSGPLISRFGLTFDHATGFGLVLAALVLLAIAWFSQEYVRGARHGAAFFSLLLVELAAVNLVLLAGDLLVLYAGLMSLSFVLMLMIGLDFGSAGAAAALRLFATLEVPAAVAFVGFWLIDARAGTVALADLAGDVGWLSDPGSWVLILPIVVALLSRAGLTPFQNWAIAGCRAAATPVALSIAGVALPVGGLVLARLAGVAIPLEPLWMHGLTILGAATAILAGLGALRERTALGWLGYLAVGQVGIAVVGFAAGTPGGAFAGWLGLASTALAITLVGMGIGLAIRAARHDRLDALGELPPTRAARGPLLLGLLALAPLPPLPAFTARRLLLAGVLDGGSEWNWLITAAVIVGTISLAIPVWLVACDLVIPTEHASPSMVESRQFVPSTTGFPRGPSLMILVLLIALGVAPLAGLGDTVGVSVFAPTAAGNLAATILLFLAVGGVPCIGYLALRNRHPERLGKLLGSLNRRWRFDRALDPYLIVGSLLLGLGRLSALTLDQTLGRLARAR